MLVKNKQMQEAGWNKNDGASRKRSKGEKSGQSMRVSQYRKNSHTGTEQICTEKARSTSFQEKKSESHTAGINSEDGGDER